jgi:hypothetical protein
MSDQLRFKPPRVEFDPTLANELARYPAPAPTVEDELYPIHRRRSPFKDYVRMLTPEGGILILYEDQDRSLFLKTLRIFTWIMASGMEGWLLLVVGRYVAANWRSHDLSQLEMSLGREQDSRLSAG